MGILDHMEADLGGLHARAHEGAAVFSGLGGRDLQIDLKGAFDVSGVDLPCGRGQDLIRIGLGKSDRRDEQQKKTEAQRAFQRAGPFGSYFHAVMSSPNHLMEIFFMVPSANISSRVF